MCGSRSDSGSARRLDLSDLYWLTDEQMARLEPYFPKSHGKPRADDRRVLSGIIFVNRNGLRWRDAPKDYGPHKTLYNRWKRWAEKGVFIRMMEGLSASAERKTVRNWLHRSMMRSAGFDNGTTCSRCAFMRSLGIIHSAFSTSISVHAAPRTSPERAAVTRCARTVAVISDEQ